MFGTSGGSDVGSCKSCCSTNEESVYINLDGDKVNWHLEVSMFYAVKFHRKFSKFEL